MVSTTGNYTFTSNSAFDTVGYLYGDAFIPSYPFQNLITSDDDGNTGGQFKISLLLEAGSTYVLIFTTYSQNITGSFLIRVVGPASVGPSWIVPTMTSAMTTRE